MARSRISSVRVRSAFIPDGPMFAVSSRGVRKLTPEERARLLDEVDPGRRSRERRAQRGGSR